MAYTLVPQGVFAETAPGYVRTLEFTDAEQTVGRSRKSDLPIGIDGFLNDVPNWGRKHFAMRLIEGAPNVRDLETTAGTFVNGDKIDTEYRTLRVGDIIQTSEISLQIEGEAPVLDEGLTYLLTQN